MTRDPSRDVDAATFQKQLAELTETLGEKVKREAPIPGNVRVDLHVLVRQAKWTYNLLFYLNADERREMDCYWRNTYTIVTLPLVRNMIDCLYNITFILQNPVANGAKFRKSGFKKRQIALEEDKQRYGGRPEWDDWIESARDALELGVRTSGFEMSDLENTEDWITLGRYSKMPQKGGTTTPHQDFLKTFLLGHWRMYSAMAHATFEGLADFALYYTEDSLPVDQRPRLEERFPEIMAEHLGRAATVLLCIVTELQAFFKFDGANINQRILNMWNALMPLFDAKELYDERYMQLMKQKGIDR